MRALAAACLVLASSTAWTAPIQTPEQFFGFRIGQDGELARYPKVLEYLQHLAKESDRVEYEELGKTTLGNPYVLVTVSSPASASHTAIPLRNACSTRPSPSRTSQNRSPCTPVRVCTWPLGQ